MSFSLINTNGYAPHHKMYRGIVRMIHNRGKHISDVTGVLLYMLYEFDDRQKENT